MPKVLVEFNSIEEAQAAIFAVCGASSPAPAPYVPPAPQATPAPVYAPPPPQAAPTAPYAPPPQAAPAPAAGGYTSAQVATALQGYAKRHTPQGAKAILSKYGVTAVNHIDPAQYGNVMTDLAV